MRSLFLLVLVVSCLPVVAFAQSAKCTDMISLRDRSGGISAAFAKFNAGARVSITENADLTARFITLIVFESYLCQLNEVIVKDGGTTVVDIEEFEAEIDEAFDILNEAMAGKKASEIVPETNKAKRIILQKWSRNGESFEKYNNIKLTNNYQQAFLNVVQPVSTSEVSASGYINSTFKGVGIAGDIKSEFAKGDELVGNMLYSIRSMRGNVATYAGGNTSLATLFGTVIRNIVNVGDQLASKKAAVIRVEDLRIEAEVRNSIPGSIQSINKRLDDLEQKLKVLDDATKK